MQSHSSQQHPSMVFHTITCLEVEKVSIWTRPLLVTSGYFDCHRFKLLNPDDFFVLWLPHQSLLLDVFFRSIHISYYMSTFYYSSFCFHRFIWTFFWNWFTINSFYFKWPLAELTLAITDLMQFLNNWINNQKSFSIMLCSITFTVIKALIKVSIILLFINSSY